MADIIDILLSASFWAAAVRIASPLIFATLGELICERCLPGHACDNTVQTRGE